MGRARGISLAMIALAVAGILQAAELPPPFRESLILNEFAIGSFDWDPDGGLWATQHSNAGIDEGLVWILRDGQKSVALTLPSHNTGERGIHSVAVDPDYATNGHVWVYYTDIAGTDHNRLSRFTNVGDVLQGEEIFYLGPPLGSYVHNGGCLAFAPDGTLFLGTGDDLNKTVYPQDPFAVQGKILHMNRDGSPAAGNPYLDGTAGNPLVWALGLRNPYRCRIQPTTGELFLTEVGSFVFEEVNLGAPAANFGWPQTEGPNPPAMPGVTYPIHAYASREELRPGAAIIGGDFVETGEFKPQYEGNYFFSDWYRNEIYRMVLDGSNQPTLVETWATDVFRSTEIRFGPDGALYYNVRQGEMDDAGIFRVEWVCQWDAPINDLDGDGLDDMCDNCPANVNPDQSDLDGDLVGDVCDPCPAENPDDVDSDGFCCPADNCCAISNQSQRDRDDNGIGDACDTDARLLVSSAPLDNPDFPAVQGAINAAVHAGTEIRILPGVGPYLETISVNRDLALKLVGDDGAGSPVVLDGGFGIALDLTSTSGGKPIQVRQLTLRGETGIRATVPTEIENCVFENIGGTALALESGVHDIRNVTVGPSVGDGIVVNAGAELALRDSELGGLSGMAVNVSGSATLLQCLIVQSGSGVQVESSGALSMAHGTIADCTGAGLQATTGATLDVTSSILYGNSVDLVSVSCNDIHWSDIGNVDCTAVNDNLKKDPLFNALYELRDESKAIDYGPDPALFDGDPCLDRNGAARMSDFDGDGIAHVDIGVHERSGPVAVPGNLLNLLWANATNLGWDPETGATEYHVYRGDLADLGFSSYGACRDDLDGVRTDTTVEDTESPPATGEAFFYLVTAEASTGSESTLGFGTCAERTNFESCP